MAVTTIIIDNKTKFHLLYSAEEFKAGIVVTGYFIYPNLQKSPVFTFESLDDGIYSVEITHNKQTNSNMEKYGLVIKEDGVVKKFEIIQIQN